MLKQNRSGRSCTVNVRRPAWLTVAATPGGFKGGLGWLLAVAVLSFGAGAAQGQTPALSLPMPINSFPQIALGSPQASQNVLFAINSPLTIGSIGVPKSQAGVQEFTVGSISGCVADGVTVNSSGSSCTVAVTFQPGFPGVRQMPLVVRTSAGTFQFGLQGTGTGPLLVFGPGMISTAAGNGSCTVRDANYNCYNGDNIPASSAELYFPNGVAVDGAGNLYIAETNNDRIREVTPDGTITTVAGGGSGCAVETDSLGDVCGATSAELYLPTGIAVDGAGSLYIADQNNYRVR